MVLATVRIMSGETRPSRSGLGGQSLLPLEPSRLPLDPSRLPLEPSKGRLLSLSSVSQSLTRLSRLPGVECRNPVLKMKIKKHRKNLYRTVLKVYLENESYWDKNDIVAKDIRNLFLTTILNHQL